MEIEKALNQILWIPDMFDIAVKFIISGALLSFTGINLAHEEWFWASLCGAVAIAALTWGWFEFYDIYCKIQKSVSLMELATEQLNLLKERFDGMP